ncbi:DUF3240 family protein [Luteithermobacter gelatinilyticus]|uniref:DUF3240 family protein n=1 Tax=Luteithermobacter gelatinilyticus TaxID=2582913 RepID=UPI001106B9DF|nr:DUF3240 family protein [Luteithermobacter gelatinilyticus]|tara:strand:+ start:5217 stop:5528 length:312 start_codon:yes stop_codon:yes gene_type:complete
MSLCLLNIIVPAALEDHFVDWLMEHPRIEGFTSMAVSGYGAAEHKMSLAEKVSGRSRRVMFQIHLLASEAEQILDQMKRDYAGADLHYMLYPLLDAGHLEPHA